MAKSSQKVFNRSQVLDSWGMQLLHQRTCKVIVMHLQVTAAYAYLYVQLAQQVPHQCCSYAAWYGQQFSVPARRRDNKPQIDIAVLKCVYETGATSDALKKLQYSKVF